MTALWFVLQGAVILPAGAPLRARVALNVQVT